MGLQIDARVERIASRFATMEPIRSGGERKPVFDYHGIYRVHVGVKWNDESWLLIRKLRYPPKAKRPGQIKGAQLAQTAADSMEFHRVMDDMHMPK